MDRAKYMREYYHKKLKYRIYKYFYNIFWKTKNYRLYRNKQNKYQNLWRKKFPWK